MHPLGMPLKRLQTASAGQFPQLDAAIPARTSQPAPVGGKGQSRYPVAMPLKRLHAGSRPGLLPLPQPQRAHDAATGEQAPIRAPGQREDRTGMRQVREGCAQLRIPEPDGRLIPTAGQRASIGGKSQAKQAVDWPNGPERGPTLYVP